MWVCQRCWRECRSESWCNVVGEKGDRYPWHVVYASLVPVEQLPLFHVCPGGYALRLVVPGVVYECRHCWWGYMRDPNTLVTRTVSVDGIRELVERTGAPLILVDGCEPLVNDWVLELLRDLGGVGARLVVKTCGLVRPDRLGKALSHVDGVVFEYPLDQRVLVSASKTLSGVMEVLGGFNGVVEVHVNYDGSRFADTVVSELASKARRWWAIHVIPVDEEHEDRAYRLVERLRKKWPYVYLYNDTSYTLISTTCPRCGADIVKRDMFGVRPRLREENGVLVCPSCGERIDWVLVCRRRALALHREVAIL